MAFQCYLPHYLNFEEATKIIERCGHALAQQELTLAYQLRHADFQELRNAAQMKQQMSNLNPPMVIDTVRAKKETKDETIARRYHTSTAPTHEHKTRVRDTKAFAKSMLLTAASILNNPAFYCTDANRTLTGWMRNKLRADIAQQQAQLAQRQQALSNQQLVQARVNERVAQNAEQAAQARAAAAQANEQAARLAESNAAIAHRQATAVLRAKAEADVLEVSRRADEEVLRAQQAVDLFELENTRLQIEKAAAEENATSEQRALRAEIAELKRLDAETMEQLRVAQEAAMQAANQRDIAVAGFGMQVKAEGAFEQEALQAILFQRHQRELRLQETTQNLIKAGFNPGMLLATAPNSFVASSSSSATFAPWSPSNRGGPREGEDIDWEMDNTTILQLDSTKKEEGK